jgi:hypothetical protein
VTVKSSDKDSAFAFGYFTCGNTSNKNVTILLMGNTDVDIFVI